jgi:uncharacterized protein YukE
MALPGPSRYQKQAAVRRRTGDITRLADQYQKNVQAVTGEYEQAFSQYQAQTREKMAPYEEALGRYSEALPEYEKQAAAYAQRLSEYEARLQDYTTRQTQYAGVIRDASGRPVKFESNYGQFYNTLFDPNSTSGGRYVRVQQPNPVNAYFGEEVPVAGRGSQFVISGGEVGGVKFVKTGSVRDPSTSTTIDQGYLIQKVGGEFPDSPPLSQFENPGEFTERFTETTPVAPESPGAPPEIPEFNVAPFEARRGQLETEFKREVGERRSARQRAVSRGAARPLLQGRA